MDNKKLEIIVEWFVWKILELKDSIEGHNHFTPHTVIGGGFQHKQSKIERYKDKVDDGKRRIQRFQEFKTQILNEPSPFQKLVDEVNDLEAKLKELKDAHEEKWRKIREEINIQPISFNKKKE